MQLPPPLVQWHLSTAITGSVGIEGVVLLYGNGICDLQMLFLMEAPVRKDQGWKTGSVLIPDFPHSPPLGEGLLQALSTLSGSGLLAGLSSCCAI